MKSFHQLPRSPNHSYPIPHWNPARSNGMMIAQSPRQLRSRPHPSPLFLTPIPCQIALRNPMVSTMTSPTNADPRGLSTAPSSTPGTQSPTPNPGRTIEPAAPSFCHHHLPPSHVSHSGRTSPMATTISTPLSGFHIPPHHHGQSKPTPHRLSPTPRALNPGRTIEPAASPFRQPPPPSRTHHPGLMNPPVTQSCHPNPPPPHAAHPGRTITPATSPLHPPHASVATA